MSDLDAVRQVVGAGQEAVRQAADSCVHTEGLLRDRADAFAGMGLDAVTALLSTARDLMERAGQSVEVARTAMETMAGELAGAPAEAKSPRVQVVLAGVIAKAGEASASLANAESEAEDALRCSSDTEVQAAIDACVLTGSTIGDARAAVETAQSGAVEYQQRLDGLAATTG